VTRSARPSVYTPPHGSPVRAMLPTPARMPAPALAAETAQSKADALLGRAWINRDLAWLEFNRRVLAEAADRRTPLLERVKFLAIFSANLDEFFMKRVALLRGKATVLGDEDPVTRQGDARDVLSQIRTVVKSLIGGQADLFRHELLPALAERGILLLDWRDLTEAQRQEASAYFDRNVSPALTPLGLDPAHPFPFISNQSNNWGFLLKGPGAAHPIPVRVKIPTMLPQWVPLKTDVGLGERRFISLETIVRESADKLFPGMQVVDTTLFRIVRNAQLELDEEENESLRESVTEALRQARFQPVVRVDLAPKPNASLVQGLVDRFGLSSDDLYEAPALLDYTTLFQIAGLDIPDLRDPHWSPLPPARLPDEDVDVCAAIQGGDILLHHPYDSFDMSVEDFISDAADDPHTVAIKMTVYRVGDDTPFVRSLIRAAESGKQVACVIELQARFDEARNLLWARQLEQAGAHVTYGVVGLKTHAKVALVVRKEGADLRCYAHIGTGNYHVSTARFYTDVGLLTCDPAITADVVKLFHYLTGHSDAPQFEKLLVAPGAMRQRFIDLVSREIAHHQAGRPARIVAKLNQLEDMEMCRALSAASQAGVSIDLIVRGLCCLAPGVPGLTDNVHVRSIIGRFLEHSRIFYFADGRNEPADGQFFIGSGDWMYRNLSRRVEVATPVENRSLRERLWEILDVTLQDSRQAWVMRRDGTYEQLQPGPGATGPASAGSHAWFIDLAKRRSMPS
jgi:polyphosphate kinase